MRSTGRRRQLTAGWLRIGAVAMGLVVSAGGVWLPAGSAPSPGAYGAPGAGTGARPAPGSELDVGSSVELPSFDRDSTSRASAVRPATPREGSPSARPLGPTAPVAIRSPGLAARLVTLGVSMAAFALALRLILAEVAAHGPRRPRRRF